MLCKKFNIQSQNNAEKLYLPTLKIILWINFIHILEIGLYYLIQHYGIYHKTDDR